MLLQNGDFLDDANRPEAVLRIGVSWLGVGRHGATGLEAELIGRLATLQPKIDPSPFQSKIPNKFSKAVSFGHSQEFIQSEKEDQEIAEACRRLIKNSIVCWNYLYLSRQFASEKNEERRAQLLEAIRHGSAATWAHFNLHGEFDFSDERMVDSIGLALPKNPAWKAV